MAAPGPGDFRPPAPAGGEGATSLPMAEAEGRRAEGEAEAEAPGGPLAPEGQQPEQQRRKIDVLLKAVGDTPIIKQKKWAVERSRTIQALGQFVKRFLKFEPAEQLFIYVNQSFAPCPEQDVGTLYECFGSDNKLVLHYCKNQAWG